MTFHNLKVDPVSLPLSFLAEYLRWNQNGRGVGVIMVIGWVGFDGLDRKDQVVEFEILGAESLVGENELVEACLG